MQTGRQAGRVPPSSFPVITERLSALISKFSRASLFVYFPFFLTKYIRERLGAGQFGRVIIYFK